MSGNSNRKASNAKARPFDFSTFTAIGAEDLDAIADILAGLVDHYQPVNSEELFAIERVALARHSLLRVYRMESGLITYGLQKASQTPGVPKILNDPEELGEPAVTSGQKSSFWLAAGFCDANRTSVWQFFLRYQGQTERFYRHAIEDFERLRRHRGRNPEPTVVEPPPEPAAEGPPTTEPAGPPTSESTPEQQFADPLAARVPTQPVVLSCAPGRVSHRRRPPRASRVVLRRKIPPAPSQQRPRQAAATRQEAGPRWSVGSNSP